MPQTLFIDTNKLPRVKTPQGEATEILNQQLAGAKNVLGTLRWLKSGEKFDAGPSRKAPAHLPDGRPRAASSSTTRITTCPKVWASTWARQNPRPSRATGASVKIFHLVVPQIPKVTLPKVGRRDIGACPQSL